MTQERYRAKVGLHSCADKGISFPGESPEQGLARFVLDKF